MKNQTFGIELEMNGILRTKAAQVIAGTCRCTKYALPGSSELARNVAEALGGGAFACLIAFSLSDKLPQRSPRH